MRPFGAGAAQMAFDALKKKLSAEGLFDADHKRPLPPMPQCIGLVTSKTGAALQDVIHIITRRWPMVKLLLAPVSVQGLEAEKSIVDGIRRLDADPRPDIILITRGGGSKEDLWVFNSERIARAAYACKKPVVSAVGHEIDTTILDYVADLRAPTPSAAAELCVPDQAQVRHEIFILQQNIQKNIQSRLEMCYNKFNIISPTAAMQNEKAGIDARAQLLQQTTAQIQAVAAQKAAACTQGLHTAAAVAASPESICSPCTRLYHGRGCPRPLPDNRTSEAGAEDHCYRQQCEPHSVRWMPWHPLRGTLKRSKPMRAPKTFEEGLQRLQELLAKMQDETTTLDQSVKLYAEAAQLIQYCNTALDKAKLQIEEIGRIAGTARRG